MNLKLHVQICNVNCNVVIIKKKVSVFIFCEASIVDLKLPLLEQTEHCYVSSFALIKAY